MSTSKRIMIIGQPGSGKSTLARRLGDILDLPVVHIDHIHWKSGWIERSRPEKDQLCAEVHARDKWIFEGGNSVTWPERLDRADTLIWLDFRLTVRAWRVFRRTIRHYGRSRPDLPDDCPERFDWEFTRWIWDTRYTGRQRMHGLYSSASANKRTYRFQSRLEVDRFLESVETNGLITV